MAFGQIDGVSVGTRFDDRQHLLNAGVHRMNQAGIAGSAARGADSIVLNEGYEDDIDNGDEVIYTGEGGRDPNTGQQIADQVLTRGNLGLVNSYRMGLPIRVVRGPKLRSPFAPASGYRYEGLYFIERWWEETGRAGFRIYRFRLLRDDPARAVWELAPITVPAGPAPRVTGTVQRLVRNTAISQRVKELHAYRCQVCEQAVQTPTGPYAEGAHVRPLGRPHDGPDIEANVLCLCPNHHVMFDSGAFTITDALELVGAVTGMLRTIPTHRLGPEFLRYHREHWKTGVGQR
jgi:putative restriction endonuclease